MRRPPALLAAVLALAACGGAATPGTSVAGATAPSATAAAAAPSAAPTTVTNPFAALVRAGASQPFKITYHYSASAQGQSATVDQTWYVKGSLMRWDLASPMGGGSSFFFLADGTYLCITAGGASCLKLGADASAGLGQQPPNMQLEDQVRAQPDRFNAQAQSDRTIAGVSAKCFNVSDTSAASTGTGTMCYSAQGLPLFTQFASSTGSFTMEATAVGTPTDADFTLPGPVRTLP